MADHSFAAPSDADVPSPSAASSADERNRREDLLLRRQLESLARQAVRVPIPVMLAAGFAALVMSEDIAWPPIVVWLVCIAILLVVRWQFSQHAVRHAEFGVKRAMRAMTALSFLNGTVTGVAALLFMPDLSAGNQAFLTMIMVCWSAGAVSIDAAYARAFYAYSLPMLGAVALAWVLLGDTHGVKIALLLMLFIVLQAAFVRDSARVFRESFEIRFENERLIRELDLERQKVMRERDRAEEANRAKSRFLAAASHDLRQPLHTIGLYSAALSLRKSDERTQELARQIGSGIMSLGSLLDGLLDISKLDAAAVQPQASSFSVLALLHKLAEEFRPVALAKGLALHTQMERPLVVQTDPLLLERVLRNLLDNAIKYTPAGSVTLRANRSGARALLAVSDTGIGIPAAEHERVFEEFYQLANPERDRSQGLGLGLAIVQRLSQLLGLTLSLESDVGRGTTFTLGLPVALEGAQEPPEAEQAAAGLTIPAGLRVLVVDDEAPIREGMRALLESWGCRVSLAGDQDAAMAQLDGSRFDLIVADYRLRAERTGIEVIREARARQPGLPALLVSGDTAPDRLREAYAHGLTLLHKPVAEADLRRHVALAARSDQGALEHTS
jgi:signal transduction histidine kinase/ActR/RegA family two-component response regulator